MTSVQRTDSLFSDRRHRHRSNTQASPDTCRWKQNLRRACLERARQSRLDLLRRKRGQLTSRPVDEEEISPLGVVMEECQNHKVEVISLTANNFTQACETRVEKRGIEDCSGMEVDKTLLDPGDHTLTEEDLFEILREVEEEMRLNDELFLEEVLEAESSFLNDAVADFENWQDSKDKNQHVPCPICQTSNLVLSSPEEISCSDEFCPFRTRAEKVPAPLGFFRDQLINIHETHSSQCSSPLAFQMRSASNHHGCILLASCKSCNISYCIE